MGMTDSRRLPTHAGRLSDLGSLERTLLDVVVPVGSAVFGLAATWVTAPHVVENAFFRLERVAHLILG